MKRMTSLTRASLGGLVLLVLAGCSSPWNAVVGETSSALAAGETRLVVKTCAALTPNRATLAQASYLTIQFRAESDDSVKFASAAKAADGTYSLVVKGLTADQWNLKVRLYDSAATQNLLFYAYQSQFLSVGTTNQVAIALYEPGTGTGDSLDYGRVVDYLDLTDEFGDTSTSAEAPRALALGTDLDLDAVAISTTRDAQNNLVPASEQGILWTTSNADVASVSSTGLVTPLALGTATVTATSVANHNATATFEIEVAPEVLGTWEKLGVNRSTGIVYRFGVKTYEIYVWVNHQIDRAERGTYEYTDNILSLHMRDAVDYVGSTAVVRTPNPDYDGVLVDVSFTVQLFADTLILKQGGVAFESVHERASLSTTYSRTDFVPIQGVSAASLPSGTAVSLVAKGATPGSTLTFAPTEPTVAGLLWTSSDNWVAYYDVGSGKIKGFHQGTAVVKAYSAETLAVLASYTVTVANMIPTVTTTTPTVYRKILGKVDVTLDTDDESGLKKIEYSINGGVWTVWDPLGFGYPAGPNPQSYPFSISSGNTDGEYAIRFRVTDVDDNISALPATAPFVYVFDQTAPTPGSHTVPNSLTLPDLATGQTFQFAFTDLGSGIALDSSSFTLSTDITDGVVTYVNFSGSILFFTVQASPGTTESGKTITVLCRDIAGNQASSTISGITITN